MRVRYHELVIAPRFFTSLMKSSTLKLQLLIGDGTTYETTAFEPLPPRQTGQVRPPMVALPTTEPIGWIEPWRLNQIMISCWLTPPFLGDGSSQMSYAASSVAPDT